MNSETWNRVKDTFDAAGELTGAARDEFLRKQCGDNREMLAQVESLLAAQESAADFLDTPAARFAPVSPNSLELSDPLLGREVGQYRIQGLLGRGGMGAVYVAEQENPRRTVALKIIREGILSPSVLRRFEHEAQMLGRLQHPGIAHIFEAGTADLGAGPRPFFAMEYVRGQSLSHYADSVSLGSRQRLALVAKICDAVQHAHQNGVIHRDLKPANILVVHHDETSRTRLPRSADSTRAGTTIASRFRHAADAWAVGQPKILDFGVARATDGDIRHTTMRTDVGQIIGTLAYMSPEQVRGNPTDVDTRSDIYSLGVITYELLTGRLPHDVRHKSMAEAARLVTEQDPTPLSSLDRVFRGDIETIVAKALDKDKERRYQSAAEFAADIERYLADRPIVARPASAWYQIRKFTRRNKVLVGGVLGIVAALIVAVIGTTIGLVRARDAEKRAMLDAARAAQAESVAVAEADRARAAEGRAQLEAGRARREADTARAVRDFLVRVFRVSDPSEARGRSITAREILDQAAEEIRAGLEYEPQVRASLLDALGSVYLQIGLTKTAGPLIDEAIELHETAGTWGGRDADSAEFHKALLLRDEGRIEESEPILREAYERQRANPDGDVDLTADMATELGVTQIMRGQHEDAAEILREVVALRESAFGRWHPKTAAALSRLAWALKSAGELVQAESLYLEALAILQDVLGDLHPQTAETLHNIGALYASMGRFDDAERYYINAKDSFSALHGPRHNEVGSSLNSLASLYARRRDFERSERTYQAAREIFLESLGPNHPQIALVNNNLGQTFVDQRRYDEAEPLLREAIRLYRQYYSEGHPKLCDSLNNLAGLLVVRRRFDEAGELFRESLEYARKHQSPSRASYARGLGSVMHERRDHAAAEALYREALDDDRRFRVRGEVLASDLHNLALQLRLQGKFAQAEAPVREAVELARASFGADHANTVFCMENLGMLLMKLERFDEAADILRECLDARRARRNPIDPDVPYAMQRYALALLDGGKADQAEPLLREALESREKTLSPGHADLAQVRALLGACLGALGKFEEGELLLVPAVEQYRQRDGDNSPNGQGAIRRIVKFYKQKGDALKAAEYEALLVDKPTTQPARSIRTDEPK